MLSGILRMDAPEAGCWQNGICLILTRAFRWRGLSSSSSAGNMILPTPLPSTLISSSGQSWITAICMDYWESDHPGLLVPYFVGEDNQGEDQGNAIGQVYGHIACKCAVDKPEQGTGGKQYIHRQRYALCIFCTNGL